MKHGPLTLIEDGLPVVVIIKDNILKKLFQICKRLSQELEKFYL